MKAQKAHQTNETFERTADGTPKKEEKHGVVILINGRIFPKTVYIMRIQKYSDVFHDKETHHEAKTSRCV